MADKPITFREPLVRALLDGLKTQDRRELNPQPTEVDKVGRWYRMPTGGHSLNCYDLPYVLGDRLWVQEAWRSCVSLDHVSGRTIGERASEAGYKSPWGPLFYEADGTVAMWPDCAFTDTVGRRRASIHMPRWASRLTLIVTDVRVQRVQDITRGDAMAEGCPFANIAGELSPCEWFADLWGGLHGPDAWGANPWVAALTFDIRRCNIDRMVGSGAPARQGARHV
ncbi:hypothetical protein [Roseovarius ramblicola]|uniref:ASCH domain protein n=1 Tax=Roseovarius ramblicola TaxID=2022336 RepID=A0ABV5I0E0_9RHOB